MSKIVVKDLFLIFGSAKRQAMRMLRNGKSKQDIHARTKCTIAVKNVSLSIKEGETFVVMGLSGSGKSSLLRCFNMLNEPTSGSITVDGQDVTRMDGKQLLTLRRKKIGMVFQSFGLMPHRTILENVAFGLEIQGKPREERERKAREVIELVGLSGYENSFPNELSGGMQQRVGIARAIADDSDILLMDEAFSALDPLIRIQMQDDLIALQKKLRKTIVFITHDLDEALKLGDTIAIMRDGEIVQQGQAEDILMNPANDYVEEFVGGVDKAKIVTASSIMLPFRDRTILGKDGPAYVLRKMERNRLTFLSVVDGDNVFKGYIRISRLKRLIDEKNKSLSDIVIDVPKITEDTPVTDLLPLFIDQRYPLTVVSEAGHPLGYINYSDVVSLVTGYDDDEVKAIIENAAN